MVAWESVHRFSTVILVEGLFDLAVLWQAGFRNTTCAIGAHFTPVQFDQLSDLPGRSVYILFDQDPNQAGQLAAHQLARRIQSVGRAARNGRSMSHSESCTRNVWFRSMQKFEAPYPVFSPSAFWPHRRREWIPKLFCCPAVAAITPCLTRYAGRSLPPPNEPAAPAM